MGYVLSHRRILNELKLLKYVYLFHVLHNSFKLIYYINNYKIRINYCFEYPFKQPKIYINNIKLINIYNFLMKNNQEYFIKCLYCNSIFNYWHTSITLIKINKELKYCIRLIQFNTEKLLLRKIIEKYSKENMDYLYYYLLS